MSKQGTDEWKRRNPAELPTNPFWKAMAIHNQRTHKDCNILDYCPDFADGWHAAEEAHDESL